MRKIEIDFNTSEYAEFVNTLPEEVREENFQWLHHTFNIPKALYIIHKQIIKSGNISVVTWATHLGMAGPPQPGNLLNVSIITGVSDVDALKSNIDPTIPLIIAEHRFKAKGKNETVTLLIDGNKRLRKAFLQKIETVTGYFLPFKLANICKIS